MKFDCGCEFETLDFDKINLSCPAAWDLLGKGLTKGLFQIEKQLGRRFCRSIEPRNIEELAAVISLIRPGCLEAEYREDPSTGKMLNITDTYVKTKAGELHVEYIDPVLEPIFKDTMGVPVYQEQIMRICTDFAGFTLQEADNARKAVGKKLVKKMAEVEKDFVYGAIKMGHTEEKARTIFSWIEKFAGYGFNKSHAVSYAILGYWGAYAKVHFPIEFFKNKLAFSDSNPDEFDEIKQLVYEAKLFNINVLPPSVELMNSQFEFTESNDLVFGLSHIKGVGKKSLATIKELKGVKTSYDLFKKLFVDECKVKKNVVQALIKCAALPIPIDRVKLLARYEFLLILTDRERAFLFENNHLEDVPVDDMINMLLEHKIPRGKNRTERIIEGWSNIKRDLGGNRKRMALAWEKYHLGMPLSGSEVELYDNWKVDTTCKDFLGLKHGDRVKVGVIIEEIREIKDKNKNLMCFMKVSDNTYMMDSVTVFSRQYNKLGWIIQAGKAVLIKGKKSDNNRGTGLLVDSIEHL
jgi:DNA polymerase-3 subunit alpha